MKSAMAEKRTADIDQLQDKIDILEAAQAWEEKKITTMKVSLLQENYMILAEHNFAPWLKQRAIFTTRIAVELLDSSDFHGWILAVFPVSKKKILPPPEWECGTPTFFPLTIEYGALSQEDQQQATHVLAGWQDSVLNDSLLRLMSDEGNEGVWRVTELFLTKARECGEDRIPEWLRATTR